MRMDSYKVFVGQSSDAVCIRTDVLQKMARNSQRSCNRLCVAQNIKDMYVAFGECQNSTAKWILGLASSD